MRQVGELASVRAPRAPPRWSICS